MGRGGRPNEGGCEGERRPGRTREQGLRGTADITQRGLGGYNPLSSVQGAPLPSPAIPSNRTNKKSNNGSMNSSADPNWGQYAVAHTARFVSRLSSELLFGLLSELAFCQSVHFARGRSGRWSERRQPDISRPREGRKTQPSTCSGMRRINEGGRGMRGGKGEEVRAAASGLFALGPQSRLGRHLVRCGTAVKADTTRRGGGVCVCARAQAAMSKGPTAHARSQTAGRLEEPKRKQRGQMYIGMEERNREGYRDGEGGRW